MNGAMNGANTAAGTTPSILPERHDTLGEVETVDLYGNGERVFFFSTATAALARLCGCQNSAQNISRLSSAD
jgi:hypothetical protein